MSNRRIASRSQKNSKVIPSGRDACNSTNGERLVWCFDMMDNDGCFRLSHETIGDHRDFLYKVMEYGKKTWQEIQQETHDFKRSKHHFLDTDKLSTDALSRIEAKEYEEHADVIFSMSFNNLTRVIGLRLGKEFHPVWYDPEHRFCPSSKRNT